MPTTKTIPDDFTQVGTSDVYKLNVDVADDVLTIVSPKNYTSEITLTSALGAFDLDYTYDDDPAAAAESEWIPMAVGTRCPRSYPFNIHPGGFRISATGAITVEVVALKE